MFVKRTWSNANCQKLWTEMESKLNALQGSNEEGNCYVKMLRAVKQVLGELKRASVVARGDIKVT
jgi:hypothetical protein